MAQPSAVVSMPASDRRRECVTRPLAGLSTRRWTAHTSPVNNDGFQPARISHETHLSMRLEPSSMRVRTTMSTIKPTYVPSKGHPLLRQSHCGHSPSPELTLTRTFPPIRLVIRNRPRAQQRYVTIGAITWTSAQGTIRGKSTPPDHRCCRVWWCSLPRGKCLITQTNGCAYGCTCFS